MPKRVDLSITIHLPDGHNADHLSVDPDGGIKITDKSGNDVEPDKVERSAHYERTKGIKYQTRATIDNKHASIGGLEELVRLDHFIAIDTNSVKIDGTKVSAAFFIVCKLIPEKDSYRVISLDNCGHVYEFHDVEGNPEMLAILKTAHDTNNNQRAPSKENIGFITDSDINNHESISKRETPIYAQHLLPEGFSLFYASADTGQELTNKLIRFCDKESSKYLKRLKEGAFRKTGLATLEYDETVQFRYTYYPSLEMINPIITGVAMTPDTEYTVQYSGDFDE